MLAFCTTLRPEEMLMESATTTPTQQDKQVTVDVPEERVAEFYAFYARFLAGRGRGRHAGRGPGGRHHGDCHGRRRAEDHETPEAAEA
jgi:hypothetical protein